MVNQKSLRLVGFYGGGWTSEKCILQYIKSDTTLCMLTTLCNMTHSLKHKRYGWTGERCTPWYIKSDMTLQNRNNLFIET